MKTSKHIADRIRLLIATRQFQVGELLPSTRVLGKQLDSSFHTVRKAYQMLADEGLLKSERVRGFVVSSPRTRLNKSERLDKGAEKFRELLEELIGYGLDEEEVETLFQEQLNFMDWPERINSCATIGPTYEIAQMISAAVKENVGVKSDTMIPDDQPRALHYDALFVPLSYYHHFQSEAEEAILIPLVYHPSFELMLSALTRRKINSIGLVAVEKNSLPVLADELRSALPIAEHIETGIAEGRSLPGFAVDIDVLFYTPSCARLVEQRIPERKRRRISYDIAPGSAEMIRSELWDES
ncbi:MAG: GntR family transcriptional regulator [Cyclonatronaceae bacterium]